MKPSLRILLLPLLCIPIRATVFDIQPNPVVSGSSFTFRWIVDSGDPVFEIIIKQSPGDNVVFQRNVNTNGTSVGQVPNIQAPAPGHYKLDALSLEDKKTMGSVTFEVKPDVQSSSGASTGLPPTASPSVSNDGNTSTPDEPAATAATPRESATTTAEGDFLASSSIGTEQRSLISLGSDPPSQAIATQASNGSLSPGKLAMSSVTGAYPTGLSTETDGKPPSYEDPKPTSSTQSTSSSSKPKIDTIVGAAIGSLLFVVLFVAGLIFYRRRKRDVHAMPVAWRRRTHIGLDAERSGSTTIQPFILPNPSPVMTKNPVSPSLHRPTEKIKLIDPTETDMIQEPEEEDLPISRNSNWSGTNLSITVPSERQRFLQQREEANIAQLVTLESRLGSSEWVSRAELNSANAEIARLRAENAYFREMQESDWALGLSDEMPPPYLNLNSPTEPRHSG